MATLHLPKKRHTIPGKLDPQKTPRRALDENLEETFPVDDYSATEPQSAEDALVSRPEKADK